MRNYNLVNFFDDLERDFFRNPTVSKKTWAPTSFVEEKENHYHLSLDVPGVDREHLKVNLEDKMITISGERSDRKATKDADTKSFYQFSSKFSLPEDVNDQEVDVSLHNGVLDIILPKAVKKMETRTLEIKSGPSALN